MADGEPDSVSLAELREGVLNVKVLKNGKKAVLVRRGDDVRAFHETCPHMGADLSEGWYCASKNTIQCKWHGYIFGADDGRFLENPNEHFMRVIRGETEHFKPGTQPRYRLAILRTTVRDGRVIIGKDTEAAQADGSATQGERT